MRRFILMLLSFLLLCAQALPLAAQDDPSPSPDGLYHSANDSLHLSLPPGWAIEEKHSGYGFHPVLMLAPQASALDYPSSDFSVPAAPPAGAGYVMLLPPEHNLFLLPPRLDDPVQALEDFAGERLPADDSASLGEVEQVTLDNDLPLYRLALDAADYQQIFYLLPLGPTPDEASAEEAPYLLASIVALPQEAAALEAEVQPMLAELRYSPQAILRFQSRSGQTTLHYPAGWAAFQGLEGSIWLANPLPPDMDVTQIQGEDALLMGIYEPETLYLLGADADAAAQERFWQVVEAERQRQGYLMGEATRRLYGEQPYLRVDFHSPPPADCDCIATEGFFALHLVDDRAFVIYLRATEGSLASFEDSISRILAAARFSVSEEE